jgi:hypothetical protein
MAISKKVKRGGADLRIQVVAVSEQATGTLKILSSNTGISRTGL